MNPPPPDQSPAGGETVGFSTADARRVGAATKYVEQAVRLNQPVISGGPRGGLVYLRKAKVGGSVIAAASASDTPRSATVTLQDWDSATGKWVSSGLTVTAYNPSTGGSVAANKYVTIGWVGGIWEIVLEPC